MHLFSKQQQMIPITYPYQTHHIALPGNCTVAYIDEGKGEKTLLFIHGLANYAMVWQKNIDALKQHYRCIAIDLPGNGLSDQEPHPFGMHFFAETIHHFIGALELKDLCIVGHSMGGQVALTALIRYPQCAASLVLCAPAGFETFSAMDKTMYYSTVRMFDFIHSDEQTLLHTIENSFYRLPVHAGNIIKDLQAVIRTHKPGYYRKMTEACVKSMLEEPVVDALHKIQQPTLVLFGKNDAFIPNKLLHHTTTEVIATTGTKKMPNASLIMVPDCGHFVQWENCEEVNKQIVLFLER